MSKPNNSDYHYRAVFTDHVRHIGGLYAEYTRLFARHLDIHITDAVALETILSAADRQQELTPSSLGDALGISSGAVTALVDRLEKSGFVERRRDSTDRRVVTLHLTPKVIKPAVKFFDPLGKDIEKLVSEYSDDELQKHSEFLVRLSESVRKTL